MEVVDWINWNNKYISELYLADFLYLDVYLPKIRCFIVVNVYLKNIISTHSVVGIFKNTKHPAFYVPVIILNKLFNWLLGNYFY